MNSGNTYASPEGKLFLDWDNNKISAIYFDGIMHFDYYYFNDDYSKIGRRKPGDKIIARYEITAPENQLNSEKEMLLIWNRINRTVLVERVSDLYINGLFKLRYLRDNYYKKANNESVSINMDSIMIGKIKYDKIPL